MSEHWDPQETVLSPFLFTNCTYDFQYITESHHLQKFSDDTPIVGWTGRWVQEPGGQIPVLVWREPSAAERDEDKGDDGGLQEQAPTLSCLH